MKILLSISLLLFELSINSGHAIHKHDLDHIKTDVYEVQDNNSTSLKFTHPKPERPTLREIVYYHMIEKPYSKSEENEVVSKENVLQSESSLEESENSDERKRHFTNAHGFQFLDPDFTEENEPDAVLEDSEASEEPKASAGAGVSIQSNTHSDEEVPEADIALEDMLHSPETDIADDEMMTANSDNFFAVAEHASRRKREVTLKDIPEAPILPDLNYDALPEYARTLISTEQPDMPEAPMLPEPNYGVLPVYGRTLIPVGEPVEDFSKAEEDSSSKDSDSSETGIEEKIEDPTTMKTFGEESEEPHNEGEPRTYGMSLTGDHGYVWNDFWTNPGVSYDVGITGTAGDIEPADDKGTTEEPELEESKPEEPEHDELEPNDPQLEFQPGQPQPEVPESEEHQSEEFQPDEPQREEPQPEEPQPEEHQPEEPQPEEPQPEEPQPEEPQPEVPMPEEPHPEEPQPEPEVTEFPENDDNSTPTESSESVDKELDDIFVNIINKLEDIIKKEKQDHEDDNKSGDNIGEENPDFKSLIPVEGEDDSREKPKLNSEKVEALIAILLDDEFWSWLKEWSSEYMDAFIKVIKKLIKVDVENQILKYHREHHIYVDDNKSDSNEDEKDNMEKEFSIDEETKQDLKHYKLVIDGEEMIITDNTNIDVKDKSGEAENMSDLSKSRKNKNKDENTDSNKKDKDGKVLSRIQAQTIYGNSVGSEKVTNVFIFNLNKDSDKIIDNHKNETNDDTENQTFEPENRGDDIADSAVDDKEISASPASDETSSMSSEPIVISEDIGDKEMSTESSSEYTEIKDEESVEAITEIKSESVSEEDQHSAEKPSASSESHESEEIKAGYW